MEWWARTVLVFCGISVAALLASSGQQTPGGQDGKVHRVVIEVTTGEASQWEAVLNNVENLRTALAPEHTEIEVVAHGGGIGMLKKTNAAQSERMARTAATGVTFAACRNTMRRLKLTKSDLADFVTTVDSGVAEVVRKQEAGWAYLKGGG